MACNLNVASDDIEPKPTFVSLPSAEMGRRYCGVEETGRVYATFPVRRSSDASNPERSEKNSSLVVSNAAYRLENSGRTAQNHLGLLC